MKKNKKKIWVVDDDLSILEYIEITLESEGYQVLTCSSGITFCKRVIKNIPNLVLLDYRLPDKNGGLIIKDLKSQNCTKDIPIILTSAYQEVKKIAINLGVNEFLPKPFDLDTLLSLVKKYA